MLCCCRQSYDVELNVAVPGTTMKSSNELDLKNPFFRYTGQQPQPPPGNNHTSPSEAYWNQQDLTAGIFTLGNSSTGQIREWSFAHDGSDDADSCKDIPGVIDPNFGGMSRHF